MYKFSLALFLLLVTNYANAVVVNSNAVEQLIALIFIGILVVIILGIFIASSVRESDKKIMQVI